jgi:hypothetical protein
MIDRRHAIHLAFGAFGFACLPPAAQAQQGYQRFVPFLVELPGWKANKPEGMAMEIGDASVVTATRNYERGAAHANASILMGAPAQVALAATNAGLKFETADIHMSTSTLDGFQVTETYTVSNKTGAILVALGPSAVLTVAYNGLDEDEAMGLARRFDWNAIQAQVK